MEVGVTMEEYITIIQNLRDVLKEELEDIQLVSQSSNLVFSAKTKNHGVLYIKFYLNRSSHIDHEMALYDILDPSFLKEAIYSSIDPKFMVFQELKGKTLDQLDSREIHKNQEKIVDSVISFYESIGKNPVKGYGLLDEQLHGKSNSFLDFLTKRQMDTEKVLQDYPVLGDAFSKMYSKYSDILVGDSSLVPIDTNMKNIMLCDSGEIKFIDPGELISGPILMGYGDFVAHTYQTPLCDALLQKLHLGEEDLKRLHIYAVCSSLNILAFLKKLGCENLEEVIPYGNTKPFVELIKDHLQKLGLYSYTNPKQKHI